MKKYVLPPRPSVANISLFLLLVAAIGYNAYISIELPILTIKSIFLSLLAIGVLLKRPTIYLICIAISFIGIALALNNTSPLGVLFNIAITTLALYVRANLYTFNNEKNMASE